MEASQFQFFWRGEGDSGTRSTIPPFLLGGDNFQS